MHRHVTSIALAAASVAGCTEREPTAAEISAPVYAITQGAGNFGTHLNGSQDSHHQPTRAQGQALFRLSEDGTQLSYRIIVADIENATMSHIHLGAPGEAGPAVLWLYPSSQQPQLVPGRSDGILGEGVATASELVGPLAGQPLSALVDVLRSGGAYANVHTVRLPAGEIRGQIE